MWTISGLSRMWKIYFSFKYIHDVKNLLWFQVYPECEKCTVVSSISRMWKLYFSFKYRMWKLYFSFKYIHDVKNLLW